ncbi:MAG: hypothetical protein V3S16_03010 [Candidatus Desulfatibia sp.]|uniref:hypothetical protein n=1 Tax=Candidatus Desulfatibia sp. TaxID=3101189 RepID=UPI002F2CE3D6
MLQILDAGRWILDKQQAIKSLSIQNQVSSIKHLVRHKSAKIIHHNVTSSKRILDQV